MRYILATTLFVTSLGLGPPARADATFIARVQAACVPEIAGMAVFQQRLPQDYAYEAALARILTTFERMTADQPLNKMQRQVATPSLNTTPEKAAAEDLGRCFLRLRITDLGATPEATIEPWIIDGLVRTCPGELDGAVTDGRTREQVAVQLARTFRGAGVQALRKAQVQPLGPENGPEFIGHRIFRCAAGFYLDEVVR